MFFNPFFYLLNYFPLPSLSIESLSLRDNLSKIFEKNFYVLILFSVTTLVLYFPVFQNEYSFNDNYVITETTKKGLSGAYDIFTKPYRNIDGLKYGYRPVTLLSIALDIQLFGENPTAHLFINLLLYVLILWVLFLLMKHLFKEFSLISIFIGVMFFAILPIHVEVVASIKSRDVLLVALFSLLSIIQLFRFRSTTKIKHALFAIILYALAVLSKPTSSLYIPIAAILLFGFNSKIWKTIISLGILVLTYIVCNRLGKIAIGETIKERAFLQFPMDDADLTERLLLSFNILFEYLQLTFLPVKHLFYYGYKMFPIEKSEILSSYSFWLGLLCFFCMIGLLFFLFKRKKFVAVKTVSIFLIGWFILSGIIKPGPGIIADRYFFSVSISVAFLTMIINNYLNQNLKKKPYWKYAIFSLLAYSFIMSYKTNSRAKEWKNRITLFNADIAYLENSAKANMLIADEMMFENRKRKKKLYSFNEIEKYYKNVIKIYPEYFKAWNNYGYAALFFESNKAVNILTKAADLDNNPQTKYNLSRAYKLNGKDKEWLKSLIELSEMDLNDNLYELTFTDLHNHFIKNQDYERAEEFALRAVDDFPENFSYRDHLAKAFFAQGKNLQSFEAWKKAVKLNPESKVMMYKLAKAYESAGFADSAALYLKKWQQM